ncbi:hypothetical protein E1B28_011333 [Marasmius oreades]|uniref:Peptidyl-prolyl cis-trans isomerase D n=1 Tax=Marasmius oreades TaxID=181124 RepID=A0A9P7UPV3_9AGAR|nr:uncharacterized protein E1B28_011333 [Marasmius oreades]KAG7089673.1 hypothetical protein E1B28_011333 [Marasmius oreades]
MVRPRVYMDVAVGTQPLGRIIFELFNETVPKTCENFRALCTGEKGQTASGISLYYKNSIFHRCIKDFMIQGGDFTKRNGTGGESIYGGMFDDEDFSLPLDSEGLLCMANRGPNTNGSQFFITLRECPHLNSKHVVFGKVLRGYDEVIQKIVQVPCDDKNRPADPVVITNCGELELRKKVPVPSRTQPKKRSASISDSESERDGEPRSSKRRSRGSRSRSRASDDSDASERRRRKKSKRKHNKDKRRNDGAEVAEKRDSQPRETEEEYDARLEREEKERLEAVRKQELERAKARYESESQSTNGIRYKGRGRMKYVDPDVSR